MAWKFINKLPLSKKENPSAVVSVGDAHLVWLRDTSRVCRFAIESQQKLWQVEYTESYSLSAPEPYLLLYNRIPGNKNTSIRRKIQAIRPDDGVIIWEKINSAISYTINPPHIFWIEKRGKEVLLSCVASASGEVLYQKTLPFSLFSIRRAGEGFLGYTTAAKYLVFDQKGELLCELPAARERHVAHIVPDKWNGVYFETDQKNTRLHYWDLTKKQEIGVWPFSPRPQIIWPTIQPKQALLLQAGLRESSLGLFDSSTGTFLWKQELGQPNSPELCVTPFGVFVSQDDQTPRFFSMDSGEELPGLPDHASSGVQQLIWSGTILVHYASNSVYDWVA